MSDSIDRQAAIDAFCEMSCGSKWCGISCIEVQTIEHVPSAQPDIAEKLYQYKCYITDKEGLQHEVVHTGDIRRVTGWEI